MSESAPHQLWAKAAAEFPDARDARRRYYRDLMAKEGHLVNRCHQRDRGGFVQCYAPDGHAGDHDFDGPLTMLDRTLPRPAAAVPEAQDGRAAVLRESFIEAVLDQTVPQEIQDVGARQVKDVVAIARWLAPVAVEWALDVADALPAWPHPAHCGNTDPHHEHGPIERHCVGGPWLGLPEDNVRPAAPEGTGEKPCLAEPLAWYEEEATDAAAAVPEAQDGREVLAVIEALRRDGNAFPAMPDGQAMTLGWNAAVHEAAALIRASAAVREGKRERLAAVLALPDRQPCTCREDTPVGIAHHASTRAYNEALADVRAVLAAPSLAAPEGTGEKPC